MKLAGWIICGFGGLLTIAGMGMRTTAELSDTLNIGLLNDKSNLVVLGGFLFLSGIVLIVGDAIIQALNRPSTNSVAPASSNGSTFDSGAF